MDCAPLVVQAREPVIGVERNASSDRCSSEVDAPLFGPMAAGPFFIGSLAGAILWVISLGLAGYFLGKIPTVAHNIELIAVAIVVISVLPIVVGVLRRRIRPRRKQRPEGEPVSHLRRD